MVQYSGSTYLPPPAGTPAEIPDLQFVIDHCGWGKTDEQWNDELTLARHADTCLKWSHASRAFGQSGQSSDRGAGIQRAFLRAIDAFGAERLL